MRRTRKATAGASSIAGIVFAIAQTAVKPPAAAARVPVATDSLYSKPGSRRCVWRSTKPGATTRPAASTTSAPFAAILSSTFATTPSRRRTSSVWSRLRDGATTRPPLRRTASLIAARSDQEIQHGHAHRDAVFHLVEDHRVRPVRDGGVDLDAAVHRARVHHDRVFFREAPPCGRQAEQLEVLLVGREAEAAAALLLDAQNHDDVGPFDGLGFPSDKEYFELFGLTPARRRLAKKDAIVMHPGPMNRGVEIDSAVADGPDSVILDQVENGVAIRMAVLYLLI